MADGPSAAPLSGALPALGIRARLLLLALAAVLPVLGFAGLAMWRFAEAQRDLVERALLTRASDLARSVDSEFASLTSTLRTVAVSAALQHDEMEHVRAHMAAVAQDLGANLTLRDAEGRLLLHSAFPLDRLPTDGAIRPELVEVVRAGQPHVTNLFMGTASQEPSYGVALPVQDEAGRRMVLAVGFAARQMAERLQREVPDPGWTAVVADAAGRIVARSVRPGELVGQEASPGLRAAQAKVWRSINPEGVKVVAAAVRAASGWTVGVSLAASIVDAPVRQAIWALAGMGAMLLALATVLALGVGAQIARATRSLSAAAAALGKEASVPPVRTALREVNEVGSILAQTAAALAARDAALREREAQLAQTQRLARVGGFEIEITPGAGPGGGPHFHNIRSPEYLALHGLGPEAAEEPHDAWEQRIHPGDRARVARDFAAAIAGRDLDYASEYRVVTPAGETRWLSSLAGIERDALGRARRMRGVHVDVSALRRTEARLRENQADLAAAEERLRLALEAGGLIAWDLDLTTEEGVWSPGHFAVLGVPAPADGRSPLATWLALVHPEDRAAARAARDRAVAEGSTFAVEHRIRRADGAERWIAVTGRVLPGTARFVGVYADVTERRAAQDMLEVRVREAVAVAEGAQAQLAQGRKLEALGQLTGGVAHDFNNLLQVVASSAALLRKREAVAADPGALRLLAGMAGAADRGAALTQRMLAFARRQELRISAVDTGALVGSLKDMLARSLGPGVGIDLDLPDGLWWVRADSNQLELALLNLCVNARDAMPPNLFPTGRIRIAARNAGPGDSAGATGVGDPPPCGDSVVISVSDEGQGMDAVTLARAMDPFFTTKGVGRGTGLGLSMVHGLCAQSGGALRLRSSPGQGTTAEMWLPRAEPGEDLGPPALPAADSATPPSLPARSVLVVDDDPLVLASTAALLADLGHKVREVGSAAAALEALRAGPLPDLVVTDHAMPGMTGAELAARLAISHPGLPVILASGYADLPAGAAPAVPRLDKPFGREALARLLAEVALAQAEAPLSRADRVGS